MSNAGDLRIQISADLGTAERALNKLKTDAQAAGDAGARGLSRLEASLAGVNRSADTATLQRYNRQIEQIQRSTAGLESSFNRATGTVGRLAAALGGVYAAQRGAAGFVALSDQATLLEGRLRLVTSSAEELTSVQRELFQISQRTRSEFASNVELYTRSSQALRQLGATSEQTLRLTETLNQAFSISGATSAEASNALIQLSQAFSSGVLRGEELNSVMEQGPRVIQALSDALGKTRGELRAMAEEGQLTSRLVFDALLNQAPKIANDFSNIPRTVGQAMTQLRNDFLMAVQQTNNATGSTAKLVEQVDRLRNVVQTSDFQAAFTFIARGMINVIEDVTRAYSAVSAAGDATRTFFKETYNSIVDLMADAVKVAFETANEIIIAFGGAIEKINSIGLIQIANPFATWDLDSLGVSERIRAAKVSVEELADISGRLADTGGMVEGQDALRAALERQREQLQGASGDTSEFTYELGNNAKELERAAASYAKAQLTRMRGYEDTVSALQREIQSFGQSEGAVAELEFRFTALEAAKRAAADAKRAVSPEEIAAIDQAAASVGQLTDQLVQMREAEAAVKRVSETIADLDFQNSLIGLSDVDREIASTLNNLNLSYQSLDGIRIAGAIRYGARQKEINESLDQQRQILENVASTFLDIFDSNSADSFFDRVMKGLADIGRQFAELGKQKLMETLFGGALNYTGGQPAPGQRSVATPGFSAGIGASNDNVAINARNVANLNTSLERSSRSALDVARQFNGLNERADSKVLDSFMQASGTWNNLSAKDTAWCAAFANAAIIQAGGQGTGSNLASSFMNWGQGTNAPQVGDIVVLKPQSAGASGHVGFLAGFENGRVQIFGGNQSNAANTKSFGLDQVRGYRTGVGVGGAGIGGSVAMPTYARNDPWNSGGIDLRSVTPGAGQAANNGWFGQGGKAQNFLQSGFGMGAMNALGAFGAGQQGGYASGALTGALGGLSLGPVGVVAGIAGGLLGGLFGGRQKRKQEHQQRAEAWAAQAQQWQAFQDEVRTGVGPTSGLRASQSQMAGQLTNFVQLGSAAWKNGKNNSSELFSQVSSELGEYFARTNAAFQQSFEPTVQSLRNGLGMEGLFVQAQKEVFELGKTLSTFIDDTKVVFGEGSVEAQRAAEASIAQLRSLIGGSQELSEIGAALQAMEGAGAALRVELENLGSSAEEAGRAVSDDISRAIQQLRGEFSQGVQDQLWSLDGKGYITEFRQLFADVELMMADARLLGVDTNRVTELFNRNAQALVDNAQLSEEALAELLTVFPELEGVVRAFADSVSGTAQEIADAVKSYEDRIFDLTNTDDRVALERRLAKERVEAQRLGGEALIAFEKYVAAERNALALTQARVALELSYRTEVDAINEVIRQRRDEISTLERAVGVAERFRDSIRSLLDTMLTDQNLSTLGPQERLAEAQRQYQDTLTRAMAGDEEAQNKLAGISQQYLDEARSYYASSEEYGRIFNEVRSSLQGAERLAINQISEAKQQIQLLESMIKKDEEQLSLLEKQYNELLNINGSVIALHTAMAAFAVAQKAVTGGAPVPGVEGGGTDASFERAVAYLNANPDVARGITAGQTFGLPAGSSLAEIARAHWERHGKNEVGIPGRVGYAMGGLVSGPGTGTSDSIPAMLSNGEFVMPAMRVRDNLPTLEAMRSGRMVSNDNSAVVNAIGSLERRVDNLTRVSAQGSIEVASKVEDGNRIQQNASVNAKRSAMRMSA